MSMLGSDRNTVPWLAVLAAGLVVSSAGCNRILGIKEAQLSTETGGSSGTGSASGDGGSTSGGSGSGGSASGGSASGGSSSGGTSGTGGSPSAECGSVELDSLPPKLVAGCVHRASCDPLSTYTISACLSYTTQGRTEQEFCTAGATSCAAIDSCLGRGIVGVGEVANLCESAVGDWACEGDVAVFCGGADFAYHFDCSQTGGTCMPYPADATDTSMVPCAVGGGTPCDESPGEFHCDGNTRYECIGNVQYGWDCTYRGGTCVDPDDSDAYCRDSVTECSDPGVSSCSDGILTTCALDGYELQSDCSLTGLTCSDQDYCLAPGCEPADADLCNESCSGTSLQLCVGGAPVLIDCMAFGFEGCDTYGSDLIHAYCYGSIGDVNSCDYAYDGVCDEPLDCDSGTDTYDCLSAPQGDACDFVEDGVCDEPDLCPPGTDTADCSGG
jgi:hypothetical protein